MVHSRTLILRDGSRITTDARGDATGGDITLTVDGSLILLDDSAIVARAEVGPGGAIRITTQSLLQSPASRIDASSQLGIDGVVDISTSHIDPAQGVADLPETPVNPPPLDQHCQAGGGQSISCFVSTGRGGLPPSPMEPLSSSDGVWEDVRPPALQANSRTAKSVEAAALPSEPIVEAQGWRLNQQGQMVLVAAAQSQRSCGG